MTNNHVAPQGSINDATRKRLATVQAELARRGFELWELANGALLVLRAGHGRQIKDVAGVQALVHAVDGES